MNKVYALWLHDDSYTNELNLWFFCFVSLLSSQDKLISQILNHTIKLFPV